MNLTLTRAGDEVEEAQAQAANPSPGILQSLVVMIFFFTLSVHFTYNICAF
jgi:hypothetical protein